MVQNQISQDNISYELALKLRDLEEGQKLMKERIFLIGQNLIESQEKNSSEIIEIKKEIQDLKTDIKRMKSIIETISDEVSKSARKEELAILSRQYKMFEPLKYVRIEDVEKVIDEKIHHKAHKQEPENKSGFWSGKI
ncbi:MAG: hypothetical protein QXI33_00560 [Candidatus Pacearchaeota archaeon]